jgi:hypothetical protein
MEGVSRSASSRARWGWRAAYERFGLSPEIWIRPERVERENLRPDFAGYCGAKRIAYIEVELGDRDQSQGKNYLKTPKEPVLWIVGQANAYGDLSLEKIAEIAGEVAPAAEPQARANLCHLQLVIKDGLARAKVRRPESRLLPSWFLNHPGLAVIATTLKPLMDDRHIQNWNFQPDGVSLRLVGMSQDVNAGRMGFALVTGGSRDTNNILVPTRSEIKKRLRGRLEEWGSHYDDLVDRMLVNSVRRSQGNGRERVSVNVFDEHHDEVAKLFAGLVSAFKRAPV